MKEAATVTAVPNQRRPILASLTGVRGPLAVWVVLFHYERNSPGWSTATCNVLGNGYITVGFFFQLSGFFSALGYKETMMRSSALYKRALRLYPALWASIFVGVAAELAAGNSNIMALSTVPKLLCVLAAGHAWSPSLIFDDSFNGPSWSVSCELFFAVALLPLAPRLQKASSFRACSCILLLLLASLLSISFTFRALDLHNSHLKFFPPLRLPQFLIGYTLGVAFNHGHLERARPYTPCAAALAGLSLVAAAAVAPPFAANPLYPFYISGLLDPLWAILIISLALPPNSHAAIHAALSSRPLIYAGKRSYALYLLQSPIQRLVRAAKGSPAGEDQSTGSAWPLVYWPALLAAAEVLHRIVERRAIMAGGFGLGRAASKATAV